MTVPAVFVMLFVGTLGLPVLLSAALLVDLIRRISRATPFVATRLVAFGWLYILGEAWALVTMTAVGLFGRARSVRATFSLQRAWTAWNLRALRVLFNLDFDVTGSEVIAPGPIVLISRHASIIDTMLPAAFVARPHDMRLRYVLKKELLMDPALDIGGNRLPNYFVDRASTSSQTELEGIRRLAAGLEPDEGVLIYPEGTRYSEEKRIRFTERLQAGPEALAVVASSYRRVLPPRPGGTLALLEAGSADVVVLMHRGLEGFATVKDIWQGGIIGSTISVHFRRVPRSEIPAEDRARLTWLFDLWASVDAWVISQESRPGVSDGH